MAQKVLREVFLPCDDVVLAIGQENAFPWIERDLGAVVRQVRRARRSTLLRTSRHAPGVFFGGDSAFGPKNIIWAVEHGHQAAISIHKRCEGSDLKQRMPRGVNLVDVRKWAFTSGATATGTTPPPAASCRTSISRAASRSSTSRSSSGSRRSKSLTEVERCLNCDLQTVFTPSLCIECDACIDICPVDCLAITPNGDAARARGAAQGAAPQSGPAVFRFRAVEADRPRDAQRREPLRPLRVVRRALSDGRVGHAEINGIDTVRGRRRRPAGSGRVADHKKSRLNDFVLKLANVNGTGSASANSLLMKAVFRMGIPVSGKNFFPSNIQGLPTWYEIRVSGDGYLGRSGAVDVMVAMNCADLCARPRRGDSGRRTALRLDLAARSPACTPRHTRSSACRSRGCATSTSRTRARGS